MRDFWLIFVSNHLTTPMQLCGRRHRKAMDYEAKVSQVLKELVTEECIWYKYIYVFVLG